MSSSAVWQKVTASVINCSLILALTAPFYPLLGESLWKFATIATFFAYNVSFRKRCLGMRIVGTFIEPPTSLLYTTAYSLGFATCFYSVWFPGDLLIANAIGQIISVSSTGNTMHANLANQATITREQYLLRIKSRAYLLLMEDKFHAAVASMKHDLEKWPELQQADFVYELGNALARNGNYEQMVAWVRGFR